MQQTAQCQPAETFVSCRVVRDRRGRLLQCLIGSCMDIISWVLSEDHSCEEYAVGWLSLSVHPREPRTACSGSLIKQKQSINWLHDTANISITFAIVAFVLLISINTLHCALPVAAIGTISCVLSESRFSFRKYIEMAHAKESSRPSKTEWETSRFPIKYYAVIIYWSNKCGWRIVV